MILYSCKHKKTRNKFLVQLFAVSLLQYDRIAILHVCAMLFMVVDGSLINICVFKVEMLYYVNKAFI